MNNEYTPLYYDSPTQVRYWAKGAYYGGIAYQDYIIGNEGQVLLISKIISRASVDGISYDDAIIELSWKEISNFVLK